MTAQQVPGIETLCAPDAMAPYLVDWRGQQRGRGRMVVLPRSVEEVVRVVKWCGERGIPIVPQGGNTSLVGGSVPDASGQAVLLSLRKLDAIVKVDPQSNLVVAQAGAILQDIQQAAAQANRLFPLSLAAEGSCTIGGNLSTNAGGTAVLQYGNARELCLGLEVVLPDGTVLSDLAGLRKDNTGINLRHLFIGAEGTLGIITAAALRLYALPRAKVTSFAAVKDPQAAIALLSLATEMVGSGLTAFELMSRSCVESVHRRFAELPAVFSPVPAYQVLVEISDQDDEAHANRRLLGLMECALERGIIDNATVATSTAQSRRFWAVRERVAEAQNPNLKHDITLPVERIARFMAQAEQQILAACPGAQIIVVGHVGDGNLHYNVEPPPGTESAALPALKTEIEQLVYALVAAHGGSISAEHGIGRQKVKALQQYKAAPMLQTMRSIKSVLDPAGLMNPGVVFESAT
jgi:FAD/FMN-containing dehydrogenase